jgi:ABC-type amino acid transport substrate-binding protein
MRRLLVRVAWGWLIAAMAVLPAQAEQRTSAFADIQRVLDAGVLRVAILDRDIPPMIMAGKGGELAGAEPDLARDLAAKLGVEVEFVRSADTYDGVVDQVAALEADLGISFLSSGPERALRVYFSRPYIRQSGRVFFNRTAFARLKRDYDIDELGAIPDTAAVDAVVFGVLEGSIYETVLERDLPEVEITRYPDLNTLMQAVKDDRIFGGVHGELQIAFYMREHPSTAIHVAVDRELRSTSDISIAVRPDAPNLLRWVDVYLATNVGVEESDAVVERYADRWKNEASD